MAAFIGACGEEEKAFAIDVAVAPEVEAAAASWVLTYFDDRTCEDIPVAAGEVDLVRTATPALRRTGAKPSDLGTLDFTTVVGVDALDVRAVDADGTPLALRCIPVTNFLEQGRFRIFPLAPADARIELVDGHAIVAGTSKRDARVRVVTAAGDPVRDILVSAGIDRPLVATDGMGYASIATPTTTPPLEAVMKIEAYGVAGAPALGRATVLAKASCPEVQWSSPLASGSLATSDLAAAEDVVVVLRPEMADVRVVEVFRGTGRRASLERVTTATTAGSGPIAVARDQRNGSYTVAVGAGGGVVHLLSFDPAGRTIVHAGSISAGSAGALPRLDVLILATLTSTGGPDLVIGAPELRPRGLIAPSAGQPASFLAFRGLLPSDDVAPSRIAFGDLDGDGSADLVLASARDVSVHPGVGRRQFRARAEELVAEDTTGRFAIGALDVDTDRRADLVIVDTAAPVRAVAFALHEADAAAEKLEKIGSEHVSAAAEQPFIGDFNGDAYPDVLVLGRGAGAHDVLAGDGRGRLLAAAKCPDLPDAARGHQVDLDRDGSPEWVALLRDARELAVIARSPDGQ